MRRTLEQIVDLLRSIDSGIKEMNKHLKNRNQNEIQKNADSKMREPRLNKGYRNDTGNFNK